MDYLSRRQGEAIPKAIEAIGAPLHFVPPYRPDRNPIGLAFAKLKGVLRSAAERAIEALWRCRRLLQAERAIGKTETPWLIQPGGQSVRPGV